MGKQWKQCQTLFFWAPQSLNPQPAPSRARTLEAGKCWARLAQARAASRQGLCAQTLCAALLGRLEVSYSRSSSYPGHFATRGRKSRDPCSSRDPLLVEQWVLPNIPPLPGQPCRRLGLPFTSEHACAPSCHVTVTAPSASLQGFLERLLSRADYDASLNHINEKLDC